MTAGWPAKRGFSTSASRAALNASRAVLQKRHWIAAALIVSAHTGHCFVSSAIPVPSITRPPAGAHGARNSLVFGGIAYAWLERNADRHPGWKLKLPNTSALLSNIGVAMKALL